MITTETKSRKYLIRAFGVFAHSPSNDLILDHCPTLVLVILIHYITHINLYICSHLKVVLCVVFIFDFFA